jgi:hypothetical protein
MITGMKQIVINGKSYYLRFTWAALSEVAGKYGDNPNLFDPETVAFVASAGMRERHPEMTPEKIMELSPPLYPFTNDVQQALKWAYFGSDKIPNDEDVKKKLNPIGLIKRIGRLFSQE